MKSLMCVACATVLGAALLTAAALAEPAKPKPLGEADVLKLVELAIDDQAVIDRIKSGGGVDFKVDKDVLDRLRKAGASEAVLAALQGHPPQSDKPLNGVVASTNHESGTTLEITEIKRTSDGFLQVSFRYRNPTDKPIKVYQGVFFVVPEIDNSSHMIASVYYVDPKQKVKYGIVKDDSGKLLTSSVRGKDVIAAPNGVSPTYWVKMTGPDAGVDKVTFYFQDAPPIEDVPLPPPLKK